MGITRMTRHPGSRPGRAGQRLIVLIVGLLMAYAGTASATPSRVIAVPNTDVLEYGAARFDMETYNTFMKSGTDGGWNMINFGVTYGLIPYTVSKSWGFELGLDYRDLNGSIPAAADSPFFFNAKFALHEGALFSDNFPAIAVGLLDYGGKSGSTAANIMYLAASKRFFGAWRAELGFYSGDGTVMLDETGKASNSGPMFAIEYQVNKKWWLAADGLIGQSRYASMNLGAAYLLQPGVQIEFAYDMYANSNVKPTFSFQLLMDF